MSEPENGCVFCAIVKREAPASVVYEDDVVIAIMTIQPINPGHAMVVPKEHASNMRDMDEQTGMHLFKITQRIEQALRQSGLKCEGVNLFLADGEAAFQDVFHVHMNVIPRFKGRRVQVRYRLVGSAKPR